MVDKSLSPHLLHLAGLHQQIRDERLPLHTNWPKMSPQPDSPEQPVSSATDTFEHVPVAAPLTPLEPADDATTDAKGGGLNISFQFDLFYQLSQKVTAKMGQQGQNRFFEVSQTVAETFKASFSLSIEPVGSFLRSTDKSLDLDPSITNEFFDAVEGLAALTPEALENFLRETEEFFDSLKENYGETDGVFDSIKNMIRTQAQAFFAEIGTIKESMLGITPGQALEAEGLEGQTSPDAITQNGAGALLPGIDEQSAALSPSVTELLESTTTNPLQDFLRDFLEYMKKYRESLLLEQKTTQYSSTRLYTVAGQGKPETLSSFSDEG